MLERILVLVISMIFIVPGTYKVSSFLVSYTQSTIYTGIIVKEGVGKFTGCKPFIEFYDNEGLLREYKSEINYHFFFCPKMGDKITLISNKKEPSVIYTVNAIHYVIIPIIMIFLGIWVFYSHYFRKIVKKEF